MLPHEKISRRQLLRQALVVSAGGLSLPYLVPGTALGLADSVAPSNRISSAPMKPRCAHRTHNVTASAPRELAASRQAKRLLAAAESPLWGAMPQAGQRKAQALGGVGSESLGTARGGVGLRGGSSL